MWTFIKSADKIDSWLDSDKEEFAFWGRSNVGKSSLLNSLANRSIAKVSSTPGRTRLINYFETPNNKIIVDLPGYGYAKMSNKEQEQISEMIANYLQNRVQLKSIFVLIDSRHGVTPIDSEMIDLCFTLGLKVNIIVTKIDKSNQSALHKARTDMKNLYSGIDVYYVSAKTKKGLNKIQENFEF
ncbi:ribosome biogenesis GTP-binding protein YihA/YsxC [Mycoplasma phocoenae]|uniref:Probable GTP-binding protein EngB n=1 Tax=Mycoplasma phocoenae TaxID=754517 RepID=A0A858U418_9MOLU|nr:ribosome biogenesis GTP-binding protein YihA/YsxC [Mycoplasma phocoenae]QJG66809.1 YihA family ribosome biogenesis GTP-binding protein [Mycoplasma phocoenae]